MASLAWSGCSASGPAFQRVQIPEGKSVVYAYRSGSLIGWAVRPSVNCGDTGASLAPSGYHPFVVAPGSVTCSAATESRAEVRVDAKANEESYVRETIGVGIFVGRPHLQVVDKATGAQEIEACKMQ
jgi:hypothetical protein